MVKYSEIKLLPFDVILAATQGDTSALHKVVEHYDGYIAKLVCAVIVVKTAIITM